LKIGFPHMGNAFITAKALLDDLGVDYVIPPESSRRTLELGSRYVPEGACLPLKITVGNLIQAKELGADTQLMVGSWGPCRFGYYCQMQREVLQEAGYAMDAIHLEVCRDGVGELVRRIRKLTGGFNVPKLTLAALNAAAISEEVDELERHYRRVRARETGQSKAEDLYNLYLRNTRTTLGSRAIRKLTADTGKALDAIRTDPARQPLKVGIVGEIYGTIDPWTNMRLESRLGAMGVEVERRVAIGEWINDYIIKKALHLPRNMDYAKAAKEYLGTDIGGHTRETIGHAVLHAKQGFDGVIQVYPLGCMPEIVAEAILPKVSRDYDLPVLTLIIDEMTGEAGYMTRIEAFVDLLEQRRQSRQGVGQAVHA
jgi:predicted nucleotide-binding protein (sugar kinase/HSP70/actin superfamily)